MWEKGIEMCKELANLYDNEMFDYEKLSWTLVRNYGMGARRREGGWDRPGYGRIV